MLRDWIAEERQRRLDEWPHKNWLKPTVSQAAPEPPKMTQELRGALLGAMVTLDSEHPSVPAVVFQIAPELAPMLREFCRKTIEDSEG
jgi:hypothetical protein